MSIEKIKEQYNKFLCIEMGLSKNTVLAYMSDLDIFIRYIKPSIPGITIDNVDKFIKLQRDIGFSSSAIVRRVRAISSFVKFLIAVGNTQEDITSMIVVPRQKVCKKDILSTEDICKIKLLLKDKPTKSLIFCILYETGMRVSEMCNIKVGDVSVAGKYIRIMSKGGRGRIIYIPEYLISAIEPFMLNKNTDDWLIYRNDGRKITRKNVYDIIGSISKKAKISKNITPHSLRRTFATTNLKKTSDIAYVQRIMGHLSSESTSKYLILDTNYLRGIHKKCHPRQ